MQQASSNMFQLEHLRKLPSIIWGVLVGTLIVRTSYFMAWPFLIVILYRDYGATATEIGTMLAASALTGVIAGFYSGHLSDLLGRKRIIIVGCFISALSYFGISQANELNHFYFLIVACGLMRPMIEEPSKALISDCIDDFSRKELAMNIRYFAINVGGALGPLLGVKLAISNPGELFQITAATYMLYAFVLIGLFRKLREGHTTPQQEKQCVGEVFNIIRNDSLFLKLITANVLMMFVYAHYSSSIPQIITRTGFENTEMIIASLVLINTLTVILFQFPLLRLMQRFSLETRAKTGVFLMAASQVLFIATSENSEYGWFIAAFVLSLGEVIAFPTINVQIDRLAPQRYRGAYFGAASIHTLGFALAPIVGGLILDSLNANWLFALCLLLCSLTIYFYSSLKKHKTGKLCTN